MAKINGNTILSVVQVKEVLVDNTIDAKLGGYVKVLGTAVISSSTPIVNKVIDNVLYSFNSTISNNSLTTATASVSGTTVTI